MREEPTTEPALAVLDSNVVLGLFWFEDPALSVLKKALHEGALTWWACAPMREELVHVMRRDSFRNACRATTSAATPRDPDGATQRVLEAFDTLARVAGMSRAHFVRRFAAAYGVAPSDHVLARRMDRVERLLLATEMKVADIAKAAGFADPNYLAKAFRRHRGLSPLEFRATREGAV